MEDLDQLLDEAEAVCGGQNRGTGRQGIGQNTGIETGGVSHVGPHCGGVSKEGQRQDTQPPEGGSSVSEEVTRSSMSGSL